MRTGRHPSWSTEQCCAPSSCPPRERGRDSYAASYGVRTARTEPRPRTSSQTSRNKLSSGRTSARCWAKRTCSDVVSRQPREMRAAVCWKRHAHWRARTATPHSPIVLPSRGSCGLRKPIRKCSPRRRTSSVSGGQCKRCVPAPLSLRPSGRDCGGVRPLWPITASISSLISSYGSTRAGRSTARTSGEPWRRPCPASSRRLCAGPCITSTTPRNGPSTSGPSSTTSDASSLWPGALPLRWKPVRAFRRQTPVATGTWKNRRLRPGT